MIKSSSRYTARLTTDQKKLEDETGRRVCRNCNVEKSIDCFYLVANRKTRRRICGQCEKDRIKQSRSKDKFFNK